MLFTKNLSTLVVVAALSLSVRGETHTIHFVNNCGFGTPTLVSNGIILSTGADYVSNGPISAVAYLQTGNCGLNGENCTTVDITLQNPVASQPGSGSSAAIELVPPYAFSVATGFGYYNGCDGAGADCTTANCAPPFLGLPGQSGFNVSCQVNDANIAITFCD